MSTSQRTFQQVKNILGKLDQRIDSLRAQRTTDRVVGFVNPAPTPVASTFVPAPTPPTQQAPSRSPFGRATPLRPGN